MDNIEEEIAAQNGNLEESSSAKDGSICGYESLHHLLSVNLKPHLYKVTFPFSVFFFFFFCVCAFLLKLEQILMG
jgi:beta-ureidopropionase